ncbi:MAG TPA: hypothetical protein VHV10_17360 [Ktedonobacteraceae bacterium]|jgi:hypothetical protein|nr:hypothetical protein [Ktedonobacteraceae bacterium]
MKLGKLAPRHDPRTLHLANYLNVGKLPPIPAQKDWSGKVRDWRMLANDRLGDCTAAAAGHLIMEWSANASTEIVPSDTDIISAYSAVSGYDPATGANDDGAVELDVLNYWRKTGIANRKIWAYAACEPRNHAHVKACVYLFGGCYLGVALPLSAQSQRIWSVTRGPGSEPGSWGGHAIPVVSYTAHTLTVVTWGQLQELTWGFLDKYCDESYAILSQDFINGGVAPNAIDWTSLQQDLNKI